MARPDFPNPYTPLTPNMIHRINEDQHIYDEDPERWERQEREREEQRQMEEEMMREEERTMIARESERETEREQQDDLPF